MCYRNYQSGCRPKCHNNAGACAAETSASIEYRCFNGIYDRMQPSKGAIVVIVSSFSALICVGQSRFFVSKRSVGLQCICSGLHTLWSKKVTFDESCAFKGDKWMKVHLPGRFLIFLLRRGWPVRLFMHMHTT